MNIGLIDMDSHNFPNLALMKISAYHKNKGDNVEWANLLFHYDKVYVSKVFGGEYSYEDLTCINADVVEYGGTGFAITIENGKEIYSKEKDKPLSYEIEHQYPDYTLYPELTKDTAYGFLTRGCCNNCSFCIVSKKEGLCSQKVANLSEFWKGQKTIKLLDANLLACKDRKELLQQLIDSKSNVDFTQGIDARFITKEVAEMLCKIKKPIIHFAFDFMKNEDAIIKGLKTYKEVSKVRNRDAIVYMLTNYDTTHEQDMYRVNKIIECGMSPYVMIYRKNTAPQITRDLQGWCNNRMIFYNTKFEDFIPRENKTIKELYSL